MRKKVAIIREKSRKKIVEKNKEAVDTEANAVPATEVNPSEEKNEGAPVNAENTNAPSSKAVMGDAKPGANADAGASKGAEGSDNAGTKQLEKMKQQLAKIKKKLKELREIERTLTTSLALAPASADGTSGNAYTAFIADLAAKERVLLRLYAAGGETGTSRRAYDRRGGELREVLKGRIVQAGIAQRLYKKRRITEMAQE